MERSIRGFSLQGRGQLILVTSEMASKPRGKRAPKGDVAAEKENINAPPAATKGNAKTKGLKDTSNLSLEAELEAMTKALKQVSLEVEHNKAMLREKEEQLTAQAAETERMQQLLESGGEEKKKLEDKLRKLQKVQGFQPTLVSNNLFISHAKFTLLTKFENHFLNFINHSSLRPMCKSYYSNCCILGYVRYQRSKNANQRASFSRFENTPSLQ